MRALQASPAQPEAAVERARALGCDAVLWNLAEDCERAVEAARQAGLRSGGSLRPARDPEAAASHPEWMHCPQHHEWLRRFPEYHAGHPALVAGYIGLNTRPAFEYALDLAARRIARNPWAETVLLLDVQGAPMGCGCGNPSCRSWENAPGEKIFPTPYLQAEAFFTVEFVGQLRERVGEGTGLVPVLCPECERHIDLGSAQDVDGPSQTDLCQGIVCSDVCGVYFPALLDSCRLRAASWNGDGALGLLLMTTALEKDGPGFGEPRAWAPLAHRHYGNDLLPCVEPEDAGRFESCVILTDAPQDCWPVAPPPGYVPEVPPVMCGYHG